jgi:hypothetical protein
MLTKTEDLEQLAETCLATAKAIKEHLAANGKPQMTFDQNGPPNFPDDAPPNIQYARLTLREAAQRLADLVTGPEELVGFYPYQIVRADTLFGVLVLTYVEPGPVCISVCS